MQLLIYAGPGPWRDAILAAAAPLIAQVATAVTLVSGGGERNLALLDDAATRLRLPQGMTVTRRALAGEPQAAILAAAGEATFDLTVIGRFSQPLTRLFRGRRSLALARRLTSSVLRVGEPARPIRRILLASGGDRHTFATAAIAAQLAAPLGASITLLHVVSQQPIIFETLVEAGIDEAGFLAGDAPEAATLRQAAEQLRAQGIDVNMRARFGLVVDEILAELDAGGYDLLAVGTHHIVGPLDRMLLEDLTGDLLDLCPRTVLVARRPLDE